MGEMKDTAVGYEMPLIPNMVDPGNPVEEPTPETPKDTVRHFKKFQGDVQEAWRKGNLPGRVCRGCSNPRVAIQILTFMPAKEFVKRAPGAAAVIASQNDGRIPCVPMKDGPYVCISDVTACDNCRKPAEQAAAKAPSWCIVEIVQAPKHPTVVQMNGRRKRG